MENHEVDVLVIGSGAGGLTAAITAHEYGGDVLVVEKSGEYGGTSATSGGGIWIPCNHLMEKHGESDTRDAALTYMKECIGDDVTEERMAAFVDNAPKMLKSTEDKSDVKYIATPYADYFPDKPGGKDGWRTLDPVPFNAGKLGKTFMKLRGPHPQTIFGGFTITIPEASRLITRAKGWQFIIMKQMILYRLDIPMRMRTKKHRRLTAGNALVGRCLKTMKKRGIKSWLNAGMKSLIETDGRVTGAIVEKDGVDVRVNAKRGVILAAGGFESNSEMREKYLPGPTDIAWSATPGTNMGDAHRAAEDVGANLTLMDGAWWGPSVRVPGSDRSMVMFAERALPGVYIVNGKGERFLNEGASYDAVGKQMQAHPNDSWVVFDGRVRKRYAVGPLYPGSVFPDSKWPQSFHEIIYKADTLE
ncbi:MAG: FAD-dependent oxidoreductase, partial [Hellea sp.]|nr:FAD-dependent oxidoreductase [Hellea sp.]